MCGWKSVTTNSILLAVTLHCQSDPKDQNRSIVSHENKKCTNSNNKKFVMYSKHQVSWEDLWVFQLRIEAPWRESCINDVVEILWTRKLPTVKATLLLFLAFGGLYYNLYTNSSNRILLERYNFHRIVQWGGVGRYEIDSIECTFDIDVPFMSPSKTCKDQKTKNS